MLNIRSGRHVIAEFECQCGETLDALALAYETYGTLAPDRRNAILLSHGFASDHHVGGEGGWWSGLIGPGRPLDTDRYFIICANNLGSCFGSTGPASIESATGKPYGPGFPDISVADMVEAQRQLVDALGIGELAAVIGYSFGGYMTFQWAVSHPDRMRAVIVAASRIADGGGPEKIKAMTANFSGAAGWNGGDYYDRPEGVIEALKQFRARELRQNGLESEMLAKTGGDVAKADQMLENVALGWARQVDANALITLTRAGSRFDLSGLAGNIKAPLLYILCDTDPLYPGAEGADAVARFRQLGVDARFHEIETAHRHRGGLVDYAKYEDVLSRFLAEHAGP